MMRVPQERAVGYVVIVILALIVIGILIGFVIGLVTAGLLLSAGAFGSVPQ